MHGGGAFWTVRTCLISHMTKMWTENGTEAIDNGTYDILMETKQGVQQRRRKEFGGDESRSLAETKQGVW